MSQIASDKFKLGAISTDPHIEIIEALIDFFSKNLLSVFGYEVAILSQFKS